MSKRTGKKTRAVQPAQKETDFGAELLLDAIINGEALPEAMAAEIARRFVDLATDESCPRPEAILERAASSAVQLMRIYNLQILPSIPSK